MSKSVKELYDDRAFVQGRIDEARREMKLIGHRNAANEDYQGRERDIAGFYKSIAELDAEIRELKDKAPGESS